MNKKTNIEEFMVGDWARIIDFPYRDETARIRHSDFSNGCIHIEPIPLTPEILAKNGWMQNGMTQEEIIECDGENCDDTWCEMTSGKPLSVYFDYADNVTPLLSYEPEISMLPIHHVHQLQHILRDCGLGKLANSLTV